MNSYITVFKRAFEIAGRSSRKEYWTFILINTIVNFVLQVIDKGVFHEVGYLYLIYSLIVMIPSFTVAIRRLHDVNKTGWFLLLPNIFLIVFIAFVMNHANRVLMMSISILLLAIFIYMFVLFVSRGTIGNNKYGKDPYANEEEVIISQDIKSEDDNNSQLLDEDNNRID